MKREPSLRQLNPLAYGSWQAMKQRCLNSNCVAWSDYGGRGITVCQAWRDNFEAFLADMGERPSADYSLERLDRDRNYEPSNCIWATAAEQAANRKPPHWPNPTGFNVVDRGYLLFGQIPWPDHQYVTIVKCNSDMR